MASNSILLPNPSRPPIPIPVITRSLPKTLTLLSSPKPRVSMARASVVDSVVELVQATPPTWRSAVASNVVIFVVGAPLLVAGLSASGIVAAFLLGTLTWRAFGSTGFLLVAAYFVLGTAATKVKITQKEAEGVAEKRRGRRGPGSVVGSSAAGCVCAVMSLYGIGGMAFSRLWQLGFVSSFCTKLSDTVSSEIGKAYGKTTYLVTNFKVVPRGTEGAVSVEGTIAGLFASMVLACVGYFLGEIHAPAAVICVVASQIANLGESFIGASLQDKDGFQWYSGSIDATNISTALGIFVEMISKKRFKVLFGTQKMDCETLKSLARQLDGRSDIFKIRSSRLNILYEMK